MQNFTIFLIKTTRLSASSEGLDSSLAHSLGELWWWKPKQTVLKSGASGI